MSYEYKTKLANSLLDSVNYTIFFNDDNQLKYDIESIEPTHYNLTPEWIKWADTLSGNYEIVFDKQTHESSLYFELEEDLVLYQLTWFEKII